MVKLTGIFLVALLFLPTCALMGSHLRQSAKKPKAHPIREFNPPADSLNSLCRTIECRDSIRIRLKLANDSIFDQIFHQRVPYVYENRVVLFPDDEMDILVTEAEGKVALKKVPPGSGNLSLSFMQEDKSMWLTVRNKTGKDIKYHCLMRTSLDTLYYETPSCPVYSGKSAEETWLEPIMQLLIHDIRFVTDDRKCEY